MRSVDTNRAIRRRIRTIRIARSLLKHWLSLFIVAYGVFNLLPFIAPMAMRAGLTGLGDTLYTVYSPLCHQMAQRSFFLFGPQGMYNSDQLPLDLTGSMADALALKAFRGNDVLGWKVAWSDRMVYMYGGLWLASVGYWVASRFRQIKPIPLWLCGLLVLPLVIDGGTHFLSDFAGLTQGFRYDNIWLASLTAYSFPDSFYRGDTFGSFNSWMRLVSGVLFGAASAALILPYMDTYIKANVKALTAKLATSGIAANNET